MEKFKQLTHEDDLEGKIIKRAIFTDEKCVIHFINDEFCILKSSGYDYNYVELDDSAFSFRIDKYNIDRLKNFGFMSREEHDTLSQEFRLKEAQKQEEDEKNLFERLKAKFS